MVQNKFRSIETYLFFLIIALNLVPVLSVKFFPTLDGPAHLYNSNLITNLLFGNQAHLSDFFIFNNEPVPNWTGHFILSFFNLFLPAYLAEKILLIVYLISLPLAFRNLIKTISPDNYYLSYLIFPFTYSYLFFLGFYNFSLAIVFLLMALNYWLKHEDKIFSLKKTVMLFILLTLIYFSHIFVFEIGIFLIGLNILVKAIVACFRNINLYKETFRIFFKKTGILFLSSFIPLIQSFHYFFSRSFTEDTFVDTPQLIAWLKNIRPYVTSDLVEKQGEEVYTKILFYFIALLFILVVYYRLKNILVYKIYFIKNFGNSFGNFIKYSDFWLLSACIILFLYFMLPDSYGSGSYISVRLELLFFIFLIIWISLQYLPWKLTLLSVFIILFCNFRLNSYYTTTAKKLNAAAVACNNASEYILPNSIVLPLNYSDNWYHSHFSNYLGIDKPIVILENYECGKDYFPLNWNKKTTPATILENTKPGQSFCINWKNIIQDSSIKIDYIFVMGNMDLALDSCTTELKLMISKNYYQTYTTEYCKLYRKIN
jgi:hypothetical protein